jgi:hypothetical protein
MEHPAPIETRRSLMDEFSELSRSAGSLRDRRRSEQVAAPDFDFAWPLSPGESAQRLRDADWEGSALGPTRSWAPWLRVATGLVLELPLPCMLVVGEKQAMIYNDPCFLLLAKRHRIELGAPMEACCNTLWNECRGALDHVLYQGEAIVRPAGSPGGKADESYTPVRDELGTIRAVLWLPPRGEA